MPDMHERMNDVLIPLFAEHGLPRPLAIWEGRSPASGDVMTWVMPWGSFDERAAAWAHFRPLFYAARVAHGGDEFVTCTDLTLIQPWPDHILAPASGRGSSCETLWHVQPRIPLAADFITGCDEHGFATFRELGASAVSAFDLMFGPLPYAMVLASWPNRDVRDRAMDQLPALMENAFPRHAIEQNRWEMLDRAPYLIG
ncbi:hypothetical protein WP12_21550 [Sphingomonas sp. SRS2]|nr:hypothetical protein WP12_21550 [Sphingomonas sp. SRS2]